VPTLTDDTLLTTREVMRLLGVSKNTVQRYGKVGLLTKIRPSDRVVRYWLSEVEARQKEWDDG
jgi:DNA-binding transcriptional MerR regulator